VRALSLGSTSSWWVKSARKALTVSRGYWATNPAQADRSASSLTSSATYALPAPCWVSSASSNRVVFSEDPEPSSISVLVPAALMISEACLVRIDRSVRVG